MIEQSKTNSAKAKAILELYEQKKDKIAEATRSKHAIKVLDALFINPIFSTTIFIKQSGISKVTAMRLLDRLKSEKIIKTIEKRGGNTPEILIFEKLYDIIDK